MSLQSFIRLVQEILTMVKPDDLASAALASAVLDSVVALAMSSGKADAITMRTMVHAREQMPFLIRHRDEFAGAPGDFAGNQAKRNRLTYSLSPHC